MIEMPILRPVPIPLEIIARMEDKTLSFWERVKAWRQTNRKWEVMEDWSYPGFHIPKGFIFDGASIPRPLWWFLSPVGLLLIPGLIHDWGYKHNLSGGRKANISNRKTCRAWRKHWDILFRQIIKEVTGTTIIPWIAWAAVRIGGWKAWNEHRRNDA